MTGSRRSMVLVTTRDKKVASIVKTMDPYVLKGLSELECLSIFEKWAFEKGEETKHPELIKIGKEIVKKCGGVPLAAQTLGVVLYQKTSQHEWLSVRDSETWAQVQNENDIIPILKLSYDQMSSSLKECFAYCSIFRKDKLISKEQLMYHWIAHGLIQPSNKNENLEDVCETYLGDLLRRFFLEYSDHRCLYFKMHDLVHDLAQYVAGIENLIVKDENALAASDRVRHMSFDCDSKVPNRIIKEKKLRTVLSTYRLPFNSVTCKGISSCRTLRVLEYERYSSSTDLPGNVKKLKHLRYLRFCSIKGVPKSICNLLNLQFLDLKISMIGEVHSLGNLRKLRVLKISTNLIRLPEGIQKLISLRKLVIMDSHMLRNLGMELRNISSLLHLEILNCDQLEFSGLDFQELRRLKYLKLRGLPRLNQLPMGLNDSAVTLTHLILGDCNNMTLTEDVLPNLESLEVLEIHYCQMYTCLPEGMLRLKRLNRLEIDDYSHWETEHCSLLSKDANQWEWTGIK